MTPPGVSATGDLNLGLRRVRYNGLAKVHPPTCSGCRYRSRAVGAVANRTDKRITAADPHEVDRNNA